ncbi:MAG: hypothetical protein A2148_04795 [Chloroflexi bacterium RBG_16_68_14]|nr:MAG: hypothetical protein A2148_04795 [Chloroflexi bacterium RBG_16_68_14]
MERATFLLAFAGIAVFLAVAGGVSAQPAPPGIAGTPQEPTFFLGDANCNGSVNSIDAALVLQLEAGFIDSLPCPENSDLNHDGSTSSLDATLILQYDAGLVDGFIQFSLNVHRPEGLCDDAKKPTVCNIPAASEFGLSVVLNRVPPEGYILFENALFYGGLRYNPTTFAEDEVVWPDSGTALRARPGGGTPTGTEGIVIHGGISGGTPPFRASAYRGSLIQISLICSVQPQTFTLALLPPSSPDRPNAWGSGSLVTLAGPGYPTGPTVPAKTMGQVDLDLDLSGSIEPDEEQIDVVDVLQINCVPPPTPAP